MPFVFEYKSQYEEVSVRIDDDGRVAYAYLIVNSCIVADVWLYNICDTPDQPKWKDRSNLPFANSRKYVSTEKFAPITNESDIEITWQHLDDCHQASIYFRGSKHAVLKTGDKPGRCKLASLAGPLAKPLAKSS